MNRELLVNIGPRESRAALLEHGVLQEVYIERVGRRGLVGNIYKGRVSRVLPGMQAAFIDLGLARTAFLHVADIAATQAEGGAVERAEDIRRLVNQGDDIVVQIVKDPIGDKGARLTTFVSLPSSYLVYMPQGTGTGVSARIDDETERARLKGIMAEVLGKEHGGGYIVRTAAQGASAELLAADVAYLERLWLRVRERSIKVGPGELIHEDLPLSLRMLRDEFSRGVERVLVDDETEFASMKAFAADFVPAAIDRIKLHRAERPIFDLHGVEEEIARALERKVTLKSGGYLVIDQTESMTTIDINTGGFVGYRNLEDTIFRTNLEAAVAIARQLRLRNLGGIIIIDFIDMQDEVHRREVIEALRSSLAGDRAQTEVAALSTLGLVEMTRKRTRESLEHLLCQPCPNCEGRGFVRTPETACHEIFREIVRQARQFSSRELLILAHQDVVDRLLGEDSAVLAELESTVGRPIRLQSESLYEVDQYDVVVK
jgi:ribonuclease G